MKQKGGEKPTMKDFWKTTRTRKKKAGDSSDDGLDIVDQPTIRWVNKEAKKIYDDVEALQLQSLSESGVTLDYDEAYQQVLGHRSSHRRGAGPKPVSLSARAKEKEIDTAREKQLADARREAEEAKREADEANKKVESLQGQFDQLKKEMKIVMNVMMQNRRG